MKQRNTKPSQLLILLMIAILFTSLNTIAAKKENPVKQNWDKREHFYKTSDTFSDFEIRYKGKILVTNDDKDIAGISPNGYLKISKSSFGNKRSIIIESDADGKLKKEYYEGKNIVDFSPTGKEWLNDIMLEVIRKTGIGGKERALRIYKQNGLSAVFNEIEELSNFSYSFSSSYFVFYSNNISSNNPNTKNLYFKTINDELTLTNEELIDYLRELPNVSSNSTKGTILRSIIDKYKLDSYATKKFFKVVRSLDYNTERGSTLRKYQNKYQINQTNSEYYFDVIRSMSINSEKGNVLKPLLKNQKLDDKTMIDLIDVVKSFSSNSERAAILRIVSTKMSNKSTVINAYMDAVNSLSSSYRYLKNELLTMLPAEKKSDVTYEKSSIIKMLTEAEDYDANTKKTTTLRKIHSSLTNDPVIIDKYFEVIRSMDNEMEQYNVILDLLASVKPDNHILLLSIHTAEKLADNDYKHGATAILREIIPVLSQNNEVIKEFFDALEEIDHNSGKEEIIRLLCEQGTLNNYIIIKMLEATEEIEVDIEIASALINIKKVMPKKENEIDYVFRSVAKKIKSDYEYEKIFSLK